MTQLYTCDDCFGRPQLCLGCMGNGHRLRPLHRIRKWNGFCFQNATLAELGLELHLGHEGWPCPSAATKRLSEDYLHPLDHYDETRVNTPLDDGRGRNPKIIVVGHTNGYHRIQMVPCTCPKSRPVWQQMLRQGLWPATHGFPETAFTSECLSLGRSLHLECKTSISGFHTLLEQRTSLPFGQEIPVCSRMLCISDIEVFPPQSKVSELTRCLRQYRDCTNQIVFGFGHSGKAPEAGEMVWDCGCCARPGVNMPVGWESDCRK